MCPVRGKARRRQEVRCGTEAVHKVRHIHKVERGVLPLLRHKDARAPEEQEAGKQGGSPVLSWFNFNKYVTGRCRRCGAPRIRAMCQECGAR